MNKNIVLIGANSMVGKYIISQFSDHFVIKVNREDSIQDISRTGVDTVIFLAQSPDYRMGFFTSDLFQTNLSLLHSVLVHYKDQVKRFIYFSTGSVYTSSINSVLTEQSDLNYNSDNSYVISKLAGEMIVNTFKNYYKSIYILRPFYIYGKNQKKGMLFESLISKILDEKEIILTNKNGLIFNPVFAGDVAELCQHLIVSQNEEHRIINVHGPEIISLYDVILLMAKSLGKVANIVFSGGTENKLIASSNYHRWHSKTSINHGIKMTID